MRGRTEVSVDRMRCNLWTVNSCKALFKKCGRPCVAALTVELSTLEVILGCEADVRFAFRKELLDKVKFNG